MILLTKWEDCLREELWVAVNGLLQYVDQLKKYMYKLEVTIFDNTFLGTLLTFLLKWLNLNSDLFCTSA